MKYFFDTNLLLLFFCVRLSSTKEGGSTCVFLRVIVSFQVSPVIVGAAL